MKRLPRNTILTGDALTRLQELPSSSVDCAVTSPPYFQLRDYGVTGQIGLEPSVEGWVCQLRAVAGEVARVLKPTGSLWLNLGDSYSRHARYGAPIKSLLLGPERLVATLVADGWRVRNKVIWAKTNPKPSSIADRLSCTYEVVYFLVRSRFYFFDLDVIRQPHTTTSARRAKPSVDGRPSWVGPLAGTQEGLRRARSAGMPGHVLGKNPGDVWQIPTRGFRGAHFATFPTELVRRPIVATCPEAVCTACGLPWRRKRTRMELVGAPERARETSRLVPCPCEAPTVPGVVVDPFFGSGTVGLVAQQLGRDYLGIELNPAYVRIARQRLGLEESAPKPDDPPLRLVA